MHIHDQALVDLQTLPAATAAQLMLREAKRLHCLAGSGPLSSALPILRRLLSTGAVPRTALPALFRKRDTVQRKHVLRMLAVEAGFPNWEAFRPALDHMTASDLKQLEVAHHRASQLHLWFSNEQEAQTYASRHGGQAVRMGRQAVVIPPTGLLQAET